jgi:hypothetical protein
MAANLIDGASRAIDVQPVPLATNGGLLSPRPRYKVFWCFGLASGVHFVTLETPAITVGALRVMMRPRMPDDLSLRYMEEPGKWLKDDNVVSSGRLLFARIRCTGSW